MSLLKIEKPFVERLIAPLILKVSLYYRDSIVSYDDELLGWSYSVSPYSISGQ